MITTVIRNLVNNAIKFTPEHGKVTFKTITENNKLIFIIEDTGIGMKEEVIEKIFSIESQDSSSGTAGETGTGLGLIICKEFIEKNNGKIRVKSVEGKGSKFIFTLTVKE